MGNRPHGVAAGSVVPVAGFGSFELKETAGRTGRNPQSGEPITIAASKSVRFKLAAPALPCNTRTDPVAFPSG